MMNDEYNNLLERIQKWRNGIIKDPVKERRIRTILERFEDDNNIKLSAIYDGTGLIVATGDKLKTKNHDIVGGYGAIVFDKVNKFIKEVHSKSHINLIPQQIRETDLRCIIIDTIVEERRIINVICPVPDVGFLLLELEDYTQLGYLMMNINYLIENLMEEIFT